MSQRTIDGVEVCPEVLGFAREQKVEAYLPVVIELARQHFPSPSVTVVLEEDPEIEALRHIVVCTGAMPMTVEEALAAKAKYRRALAAHVPAPLICTFRLGLELAS